ncbi:hypothetical protein K438DRAFT_1862480 [Mycena galopus ATCC 62051]|nr:hypothetical protein K438DRAFT_1862480 [Mycena galopus ATCC 62051]
MISIFGNTYPALPTPFDSMIRVQNAPFGLSTPRRSTVPRASYRRRALSPVHPILSALHLNYNGRQLPYAPASLADPGSPSTLAFYAAPNNPTLILRKHRTIIDGRAHAPPAHERIDAPRSDERTIRRYEVFPLSALSPRPGPSRYPKFPPVAPARCRFRTVYLHFASAHSTTAGPVLGHFAAILSTPNATRIGVFTISIVTRKEHGERHRRRPPISECGDGEGQGPRTQGRLQRGARQQGRGPSRK